MYSWTGVPNKGEQYMQYIIINNLHYFFIVYKRVAHCCFSLEAWIPVFALLSLRENRCEMELPDKAIMNSTHFPTVCVCVRLHGLIKQYVTLYLVKNSQWYFITVLLQHYCIRVNCKCHDAHFSSKKTILTDDNYIGYHRLHFVKISQYN